MSGRDFVANLPSFTRFADVADPLRFIPAPECGRSSPPRTGGGDIVYGIHLSASALASRHLHFIYGTDGGFTFTARAMKAQVAAGVRRCLDGASRRTSAMSADYPTGHPRHSPARTATGLL